MAPHQRGSRTLPVRLEGRLSAWAQHSVQQRASSALQGIAAAFAALGVFGLERWTLFGHTLAAPIPLVIYLVGLAALYFGPRFPTLLFDPSK